MLQIELDDQITAQLQHLSTQRLPAARRQLIKDLLRETLQQTADQNPVATGRSRAAWIGSLQQLNGNFESNASEGTANTNDMGNVSIAEATNHVPYVPFLEYGTRQARPVAMLRRALQAVRQLVSQLFVLD